MPETATKTHVSPYWRSLEELEQSPDFLEFLHREFPRAADEIPAGVSRRRWMQLMGASFALAAAQGCRWQTEKIAPFAERPEGYIPGQTKKYATSINWAGGPRHLLVTCYDGRPIKVDGNPEHPASRGGSDAYVQAATLALYDPDRQGKPVYRGQDKPAGPVEWADVEHAMKAIAGKLVESQGAGLAVLMPPCQSVSLGKALSGLFKKFPKARLAYYEPLSRDAELAGAQLAFGRGVRTNYNLKQADVIACFDCDLLCEHPASAVLARDYADRRDPAGKMNRLYCVESQMSVTGACADHRFPLKSSGITAALAALLEKVESGEAHAHEGSGSQPTQDEFLTALAEDLLASKGSSVVCVGRGQTPEAIALAHKINAALGNAGQTVLYTAEPEAPADAMSLADLSGEIAARRVDTLLLLGGNPIYDAPADLDFAHRLGEVASTIHLSPYDDETSRACTWSLPETHAFESWGDTMAWDGTLGAQQPLIDPLLDCRSALEVVNLLAGEEADPQTFVREALAEQAGGLDDDAWARFLHDGLIEDSAAESLGELSVEDFEVEAAEPAELELVFTASDSTFDGRLANSGWLQETPNPMTKLTWDNAALMSPATAAQLGLGGKDGKQAQGKLVKLTLGEQSITMPIFLQPGQAKGSIGVALGYGRTAAGRVGGLIGDDGKAVQGLYPNGLAATWLPAPAKPVGVDAYQLRTSDAAGFATGVTAKSEPGSYLLATTQDHHAIDTGGLNELTRRSGELVREASQDFFKEHPSFPVEMEHHIETENLWHEPVFNRGSEDGDAWGMAIDLNKCIGCTACMVACQAENNVPVVGKDMVSRGREMHWIRIDRYFRSHDGEFSDNPSVVHQPMTCQQCETAPCEEVCPVAATTHSAEGLNDMVYNRCVGTRYCANNCPFKVRRFNYFHYNWEIEREDWPAGKFAEAKVNANRELQQLMYNPEVTIRHRGVMEKCTYCTQRISHARIDAKVEGRRVADGDIKTACQEACPTAAIVFGNLNDKESQVAAWHADGRAYGLLSGLHLRPRTKYLARIRNPHPALANYVPANPELHGHGHGHGHEEHEGGHGEGDHEHQSHEENHTT